MEKEKAFPAHQDSDISEKDDPRLGPLPESRIDNRDEIGADHRCIRQAEIISTTEVENRRQEEGLEAVEEDAEALEERKKKIREKLLLREEEEAAAFLPEEEEEEEEEEVAEEDIKSVLCDSRDQNRESPTLPSPTMEEAKRGPKRQQVECGFLEKESAREVTISKARQDLFREAAELSLLCGVEVAVITCSPNGNPVAFAHPSTPDAIIDRYLSGEATGPAAAEADSHGERYEDVVGKPEGANREAETMAAEPGKMDSWWDKEIEDMGVEELEHYVASLEGLMKLVADGLGECSDSGTAGDRRGDKRGLGRGASH